MSVNSWTLDRALKVGLTIEEGAYNLYANAEKMVKEPGSRQMLRELAGDEKGHMDYFAKALKDPSRVVAASKQADLRRAVQDLKITDPMVDGGLKPDATYQEVLLFAIKSEKKANEFYTALAADFAGNPVADTWKVFANVEAGHKLRLEKEYDDVILKEN